MNKISWTNSTIKLGDLRPWAHNPRQSTKKQAKRLLASWEQFGQVQTVAIDPEGNVLDGHQRLSALLTVHGRGYEIDARQSSRPLSEDERRQLVVTLHAGAVGSWDWDSLSSWNAADLMDWGLDEDLFAQWKTDAGALGNLIESEKPETVDAEPMLDRAEELREKWGVTPGSLWQIADHRLVCGDCTDLATVARVMQGEKAGACVTDSPYGINREGIENDDPEGLQNLFDGCLAVMPIDNGVIINFQSPRLFPVWLDAVRNAGHKFERMIWMYKPNDVCYPWQGWLQTSEAILVSSVGKPAFIKAEPYAHDTYTSNWSNETKGKVDGWHGSIKPLPLVQDLVGRVAGIVYDPFGGSGTTMVACNNLWRGCRMIEIDPKYCAIALERMSNLGLSPVLVKEPTGVNVRTDMARTAKSN